MAAFPQQPVQEREQGPTRCLIGPVPMVSGLGIRVLIGLWTGVFESLTHVLPHPVGTGDDAVG